MALFSTLRCLSCDFCLPRVLREMSWVSFWRGRVTGSFCSTSHCYSQSFSFLFESFCGTREMFWGHIMLIFQSIYFFLIREHNNEESLACFICQFPWFEFPSSLVQMSSYQQDTCPWSGEGTCPDERSSGMSTPAHDYMTEDLPKQMVFDR